MSKKTKSPTSAGQFKVGDTVKIPRYDNMVCIVRGFKNVNTPSMELIVKPEFSNEAAFNIYASLCVLDGKASIKTRLQTAKDLLEKSKAIGTQPSRKRKRA